MRNCGIPLQRRVELHGYLFWIHSGRAVQMATNVLKKKIKPRSGDVVIDKALRAAYKKVEKTFRMIRVNAESSEYVVCNQRCDARGLVSATANPCMREDGLATWQRLAAAKKKWRNVASLLAEEISQQHNLESEEGLSIHKLYKVLRKSRAPTFGGPYSPIRFCRSLIAATAKRAGGDIVFQDTRDDWEKALRHMGGSGTSVRTVGCYKYENACSFRDAVADEERKILNRDLLLVLPPYSLADLRQFLCLDKFGKTVNRRHWKKLAQTIQRQRLRERRVRDGGDRHLHRKKDVRVRKRTRKDHRVGRGGDRHLHSKKDVQVRKRTRKDNHVGRIRSDKRPRCQHR